MNFKKKIFIFAFFLVLLLIFYLIRINIKNNLYIQSDTLDDNNIKLNETINVFTKNGFKKWVLKSGKVIIDKDKKNIILNNPHINFIFKSGKIIHILGNYGIINFISKRIIIYGNVLACTKEYTIKSEIITYNLNNDILKSPAKVIVSNKKMFIKGNSLTINLNNELIKLNGSIKGMF